MSEDAKMLLIGLVLLAPFIPLYPKWSYKAYYKRCELNSTHPDWTPFCGKNFLNKKGELICKKNND